METPDFSSLFKTKAQALDFSARLAAISQEVFVTGFHLEESLGKHFNLNQKDKVLALLRTQNVQTDKATDVKNFIATLQTQIRSLPVLSVSLAFEPKEATLKMLSAWFMMNSKRQVLFDITVDESLIAGVVIHFKGKFLDYTIREVFTKVITDMQSSPEKQPVTKPPVANQASLTPVVTAAA